MGVIISIANLNNSDKFSSLDHHYQIRFYSIRYVTGDIKDKGLLPYQRITKDRDRPLLLVQ